MAGAVSMVMVVTVMAMIVRVAAGHDLSSVLHLYVSLRRDMTYADGGADAKDDTPASFSSFFTPPACRILESAPDDWMHACGSSLMTLWRFSFAPLGEPGRVRMTVSCLTPATGRAIIATRRA